MKPSEHSVDLLAAYDSAVRALADGRDDIRLKHRAVLALARAGATDYARRQFAVLGLDRVLGDEDVLSLAGRLLKDASLAASGEEHRRLAALSSEAYAKAHDIRGGHYPGINTATMLLLAGDARKSANMAAAVLDTVRSQPVARGEDGYYLKATESESALLLGLVEDANRLLTEAVALDPSNLLARASTLRQFELICGCLKIDPKWLDTHRPPPAVFYSGHMFGETTPAMQPHLSALFENVRRTLADIRPGAAFGALAAGCDILLAEEFTARGAALHVVLPFNEDEFIARSVAPFGATWVTRYRRLRERAASFRLATLDKYLGDDSVFTFSADYAMGLALNHAAQLSTQAVHIAAWDGAGADGSAGTAIDVIRWQRTGSRQVIVPFPAELRTAKPAAVTVGRAAKQRQLKALLFFDVRGFSKLDESHISGFVNELMAPLAAAVRDLAVEPDLVATWGDGIHMVFDDVAAAADAALTALERFAALDLAAAGLPPHLALRVGGHVGPVSPLTDPFTKSPSFYGTQITVAARIEPVAVPGTVYVSEPFAALLALKARERFHADYVGQKELAKDFGTTRLFSLRRV